MLVNKRLQAIEKQPRVVAAVVAAGDIKRHALERPRPRPPRVLEVSFDSRSGVVVRVATHVTDVTAESAAEALALLGIADMHQIVRTYAIGLRGPAPALPEDGLEVVYREALGRSFEHVERRLGMCLTIAEEIQRVAPRLQAFGMASRGVLIVP